MKKIFFTVSLTGGSMGLENGDSSQVLLLANEGRTDEQIAERTGMRRTAIESCGLWKTGLRQSLKGISGGIAPRAHRGG